jgi:hypothetical protein
MEYLINSDYRTALTIVLAFEDETLTGYEQQAILLSNLYDDIPVNTQAAIDQANKFLNGGKISEAEPQSTLRLYSFSKDAGYIFAAFRQTHGIDLQKVDLHWWEFLTLFMDLGADTTFVNLIGLRKRIKTGTASKEERQAARDMGDLFDIPEIDTRTLSEKEAESEFMKLVSQP